MQTDAEQNEECSYFHRQLARDMCRRHVEFFITAAFETAPPQAAVRDPR